MDQLIGVYLIDIYSKKLELIFLILATASSSPSLFQFGFWVAQCYSQAPSKINEMFF